MSVLFIVLIILAVAVTKFYMNVPDETDSGSSQTRIVKKLEIDSDGNRVFENETGLFGIVDLKDRIIVAPEWIELDFTSGKTCIASKRIGGKLLTGCIDYEGNIVIPFIYRNIVKYEYEGFVFYVADADSDGSCVIYNSEFSPVFNRSWKKCSVNKNEVTLESEYGIYSYNASADGMIFKSASLSGEIMGCEYSLDLFSRVILSKINTVMLEEMLKMTERYIEYAYTGEEEILSSITSGNRTAFRKLFADDHKVLSKKLSKISEIYVYSKKSEDDIPHYAVTITAETEISYSDKNGELRTFSDEYKADVEFSGNSAKNLTAVEGKFRQSEPIYPSEEETQKEVSAENHEKEKSAFV